ncbi:hypothetical protein SHTP_4274 [Mycobacterium ulcerans subsp. shinshuense]|uniref:Uncharacterized protein n=1 Tax=Mycobacterium ulcerans subsp. shinshuense TaxID=1124626 RepID=A0A1B4Y822_MYCUL|nr:hypothetical protein SHTP_4274 [Mycobacterium ulcerans subsp. shinshuense]
MSSLRSPGLQRSNTSGTDDTGNTETVGTGNSRPTTNSNQLDRSPDSPCLHSGPNSPAPKIINPAHKPANQQRRSPAAVARTAIANKAISEYLRPRGSLGSGTEANTSRNSDPMSSLRSPGLQRSNTSGTDDTGNTETVGTGNSRPTTNSNQLDRSPDSPCLHSGPNSPAPKIINPAHKPANQQRRSPGHCRGDARLCWFCHMGGHRSR